MTGITSKCQSHPNQFIHEIKDMIFDEEGYLTDQQRLFFAGKELEDKRTLSDYNISKECTLYLTLRLPVGMNRQKSFKGLGIGIPNFQGDVPQVITSESEIEQSSQEDKVPVNKKRRMSAVTTG